MATNFCKYRMIGLMVTVSFWLFMAIGPLAMGAYEVEVTAAMQILGFLVYYGCRVGCGKEDVGIGVPVWSRPFRTS